MLDKRFHVPMKASFLLKLNYNWILSFKWAVKDYLPLSEFFLLFYLLGRIFLNVRFFWKKKLSFEKTVKNVLYKMCSIETLMIETSKMRRVFDIFEYFFHKYKYWLIYLFSISNVFFSRKSLRLLFTFLHLCLKKKETRAQESVVRGLVRVWVS